MLRIRVRAVIIKDDKVLLIHRKKPGYEYHVFPGGAVEEGESLKNALIREVEEETSLDIKIVKLLYKDIDEFGQDQSFYLCEYISGQPKLRENSPEAEDMLKNRLILYEPYWSNLQELPKLLLYPLKIRDWLLEDIKNNFETSTHGVY